MLVTVISSEMKLRDPLCRYGASNTTRAQAVQCYTRTREGTLINNGKFFKLLVRPRRVYECLPICLPVERAVMDFAMLLHVACYGDMR